MDQPMEGSKMPDPTAPLVRVFVDAYNAAQRQWYGADARNAVLLTSGDPSLTVALDAVRAAVAERHREQWSELVDQVPASGPVHAPDIADAEAIKAGVHGAEFDVADGIMSAADIENARQYSTTLNSVSYAIGVALGKASNGEDFFGDPEALARELIDQLDRWKTTAEDRMLLLEDGLRLTSVVAAARVVAGYEWPDGGAAGPSMTQLRAAIVELDASGKPPLIATEARSAAPEGDSEGAGSTGDLRTSQGDVFVPFSMAGKDSVGIQPWSALVEENASLRRICVKRWGKIERLRGKAFKARAKSKQLRVVLASAEAALREFQHAHRQANALAARIHPVVEAAEKLRDTEPVGSARTLAESALITAVDAFRAGLNVAEVIRDGG